MGKTLGEGLQELADRLNPGTLPPTLTRVYTAALNRSGALIYGKWNWDWLWKMGSVAVPAATATKYWADLPSDCRGVMACGLGSRGTPLSAISVEVAEVVRGVTLLYEAAHSPGIPQEWDARDGKLYLFPPSASADTATICYVRKFVTMTATSDEILIPSDYDTCWVDLAFASLALGDEFSQGAAKAARGDAQQQIRNMNSTSSNMQAVVQRVRVLMGQH